MGLQEIFPGFRMSTNVADGAVGVSAAPAAESENKHWYIAVVGNRTERLCARRLADKGFESYVASQWEIRHWANGRKKRVERLVLRARVFVRATEKDRLAIVARLPYIYRFVTDPSRRPSPDAWAPVAVIPDRELALFRQMLGQEEYPVTLEESHVHYDIGDRVRVKSGKLAGLEGVVNLQDKAESSRLHVSLDLLGCAIVEIDKHFLEKIG